MKRTEAAVLLAAAVLMVVAGLVWLLGPYGLLGAGVALGVVVLFVFDIREEAPRAEPVAGAARPLLRR